MTENQISESLERASSRTPVGPAPVDTIVARASRRQRRRAQTLLAAAAVAGIAVVVGGVAISAGQAGHSDWLGSPQPTAQPTLPCSAREQRQVDLDVPGPGHASPEGAVTAVISKGDVELVYEDETSAVVNVSVSGGELERIFHVTKRDDGWWPDSYTGCGLSDGL